MALPSTSKRLIYYCFVPPRRAQQRSLFASWRLRAWGRANGCGLAADRFQCDLERSKCVRNKPSVARATVQTRACLYASVLPSASQAHHKPAPCCLSAAAGTVQGLSSSTNYRPLHACGFLGRARTKGEQDAAYLRSTSCEPHCSELPACRPASLAEGSSATTSCSPASLKTNKPCCSDLWRSRLSCVPARCATRPCRGGSCWAAP